MGLRGAEADKAGAAAWRAGGILGRVESVVLKHQTGCGMGHLSELGTRLLYFVDLSERGVP